MPCIFSWKFRYTSSNSKGSPTSAIKLPFWCLIQFAGACISNSWYICIWNVPQTIFNHSINTGKEIIDISSCSAKVQTGYHHLVFGSAGHTGETMSKTWWTSLTNILQNNDEGVSPQTWLMHLFIQYVCFFNLGLVTARQKSALCCLVGSHASANVGPVVLCWYFGTLQLPRGWLMGHSGMWVRAAPRLNHGPQCHVSQFLLSFTLFYTSKHAKTNDCKRIRGHVIQPLLHHTLPLRTGLIGGEVSRLGAQVPTCSAPWILQRQVSARHQLHRARDQRVVPVISSAHQVVKFELAVSCGVKKYVKPIVVSWWFQWFYVFSKYPSGTGYSTFYPF
jgi:hypothetical protein